MSEKSLFKCCFLNLINCWLYINKKEIIIEIFRMLVGITALKCLQLILLIRLQIKPYITSSTSHTSLTKLHPESHTFIRTNFFCTSTSPFLAYVDTVQEDTIPILTRTWRTRFIPWGFESIRPGRIRTSTAKIDNVEPYPPL